LNGDDVTKEIRSLGKAIFSEDKKKLNISYPAQASDFHQGEYAFEVSTTGETGDKALLNIQEYNGKAICVNCDSASRSISDADLDKIIEEETRTLRKATSKPKVNGECNNNYYHKYLASKPSSNRCMTGKETTVKGNGSDGSDNLSPWSWNCNGSNDGKNAVCSAWYYGYNCVVYAENKKEWLYKTDGLKTMKQKMKAIDEPTPTNAQIGYVGVQRICQNSKDNGIGHVFIVTKRTPTKGTNEDGSITLTVEEANYDKGKVTYTRTIRVTDNDKNIKCGTIVNRKDVGSTVQGYICDWGKHGR
jgi:hypothetical protein